MIAQRRVSQAYHRVRTRRRLVLACAIVGGALGWMLYIVSPKTYAATCVIYEPRDPFMMRSSFGIPQTQAPSQVPFPFVRSLARIVDRIAERLGSTNITLEQRLDKCLDENWD